MVRWLAVASLLIVVAAGAAAVSMLELTRPAGRPDGSGGAARAALPAPASVPALSPVGRAVSDGDGGFSRRDDGGDPAREREPGEALVATEAEDFRTRSAALGFRVLDAMSLTGIGMRVYRLGLPAETGAAGAGHEAALARLRASFPDAAVDSNHHFRLAGSMSLPDSVARAAIGWESVSVRCGSGVRIAMIDAAVDVNHPALRGARISYQTFVGKGRSPGDPDHGTAVAALLVGQHSAGSGWGGLVPEAALYAANIFESRSGDKTVATADGLLKAVDWVIGRQVHVVNLSIAGPDNAVVRRAIDRVLSARLVLIAAAGNWGSETRPAYPAAYDNVIAVTAIGADRSIYRHANRGSYIQFAAPGVRLWTAVPDGGKFQSGTSFATPFVSALAGLAVASGVATEPERIRARLQRDAIDLGRPGWDPVYGWGLIGSRPECGVRAG